ncbi:MAG: foldase protein PrsA, partial [Gaiellaceae bacterium]|nr:foldase protein PrsA [Gaiellaceae bacterium]
KAAQAKADIQGGQGFGKVAKAMSIDQASKATGGKLPAVTKGQQEKAFDTAIFAAKRGQLRGPIKTQFGYYVFRVTKITKASQQTLAEATPTIKQLLKSQNEQGALDKFVKSFEKKWKAKTDCKKGFQVQSCKNAPKTPTGASGAVGAPQQAPSGAPPAQQQPTP